MLLVLVAGFLSVFSIISRDAFTAAIFGVLLSMVFVTAGYFSFIFALKYQQKKFNKIIGISILGRLLLMTLSIVSIFVFLNINRAAFLIGMFVSYFVMQILEVVSINKIRIGKT
jgi:hypothetical protein